MKRHAIHHVKYLSQHSRRHIRRAVRPAGPPLDADWTAAAPAVKPGAGYAWLICGCCVLLLFCSVGLGANTLPIYFPFLMRDNGFTNTQLSAITTLRCFVAFFGMGLTPRLVRRCGLRSLCGLACLLLAAAFFLLSVARTPLLLYTAALGVGLSYGCGSMILVSVLVRNWFRRREGFALGLSACGSGLANLLCSPLITAAIESWGVTTAARLEAGLVLLIGLLIYTVVRDTPQQAGRLPYGAEAEEARAAAAPAPVAAEAARPRPKRRRRHNDRPLSRRHRRLMLLAMLALGPCNVTVPSFFTMHYSNCGYSSMSIALGLSLFGLVLTLAKLAYGWSNDHIGVYRTTWIFLLMMAASDLLIAASGLFAPGAAIYIALSLSAAGNPPAMIGTSLWARDLWPQWQYTQMVARYQQLGMVGAIIGSLLGGVAADIWGGYVPTYVAGAAMALFVLASVQSLYRKYTTR